MRHVVRVWYFGSAFYRGIHSPSLFAVSCACEYVGGNTEINHPELGRNYDGELSELLPYIHGNLTQSCPLGLINP